VSAAAEAVDFMAAPGRGRYATNQKKKAVNSNPHADDHEWPLAVVLVDLGSVDFPGEIIFKFPARVARTARTATAPATDTTRADSKAGI
jgi:hypothetical protein